MYIQAKADALSGKVERLVTWRWAEHPVKGAESEMEDDVIAGTNNECLFCLVSGV